MLVSASAAENPSFEPKICRQPPTALCHCLLSFRTLTGAGNQEQQRTNDPTPNRAVDPFPTAHGWSMDQVLCQ